MSRITSPQRFVPGGARGGRLAALFLAVVGGLLMAASPAWADDLALNRPASASSTDSSDRGANRANDGNSATRWSSAYTDNQWWEVDLGSERMIDRVELNWEVAYASEYRIRTRTSESNAWSTAADVSIGAPGLKVHTFAARSARYVQIRGDARGTQWGISLWDARVCDNNTCGAPAPTPNPPPTPDPNPNPNPNPNPTPDPTAPTLREPDGGRTWFQDRGWTAFPVGTWGSYAHATINRDLDASAGLNTYLWVADDAGISPIRTDGRFKVIQDHSQNLSILGTETEGIGLGDEEDMTAAAGWCPGLYNQRKQQVGSAINGRFWFVNGGKGLTLPPGDTSPDFPVGSHNWWANTAEANCLANSVDFVSNDQYWFTGPYDEVGDRYGFLYGENIKNLRRAANSDGVSQPTATYVEAGWPFENQTGARAILPAELRSAVWHSLIAGARAVLYFNHSFGGPCAGDHHVIRSNCNGTRPMVTSVNAQVQSLRSVLNGPSVTSDFSTTGDVERSVKWDGSNFYVLAGARYGATTMNFDMPCVGDATATVLGENRSVSVSGGKFSDQFADKNAIHIYRIDGGSRCGL